MALLCPSVGLRDRCVSVRSAVLPSKLSVVVSLSGQALYNSHSPLPGFFRHLHWQRLH